MRGFKQLSTAFAAGAMLVAPLYSVTPPAAAAPAPMAISVSKLERRTQRECEEAGEILGKVQAGKMKYPAAMKKLRGFRANAEELLEKS